MRRLFLAALTILITSAAFAQTDTVAPRKGRTLKPGTLPRSNDHLVLQLGYTLWQGKSDSINTSGIPRTFNAYFMLDFPFKTNPHWSVAVGAGIATDNIFFKETSIGIAARTSTLSIRSVGDTNSFKKYKLATTYLEAPIELRFSSKPDDNRHSIKIAVGAKVGTMLNAHTKGKNLQDKNGNSVNDYKVKEYSKKFFNTNRLSVTGRIGYGNFSLFSSFQITPLFKEGLGPTVRPLTIGLTLSGL